MKNFERYYFSVEIKITISSSEMISDISFNMIKLYHLLNNFFYMMLCLID